MTAAHILDDYPIRLTNAPVEFIETRLTAEFHTAFGDPSIEYIVDIDRFGDEADMKDLDKLELWKEASEGRKNLFEAMERYEQKAKLEHKTCQYWKDIRRTEYSWEQVMAEVQQAKDRYQNKGKVCEFLRKLGDNAEGFQEWLSLLPDGDYGGPICGAFKIGLKAASSMSSIRILLFQTLADIPEKIHKAKRYLRIYRHHRRKELVRATAKLYAAIVVALGQVFEYLTKDSIGRIVGAIALGSKYEKKLRQSLDGVSNAVKTVEDEANMCLHEVNEKSLGAQYVNEQQRRFDNAESTRAFSDSVQALAKAEDLEAVKAVANQIYLLLLSNRNYDPLGGGLRGSPELKIEDSYPDQTLALAVREDIRPEQILNYLSVRPEMCYQDLEDRLRMGGTLELSDQGRVTGVMKQSRFREWLTTIATSGTLLINGNSSWDEVDGPLSFICAKVARTLLFLKPVITLYHFCGLHRDQSGDAEASLRVMMNHLLCQLLHQTELSVELSFLDDNAIGKLRRGSLKTLRRTLITLIAKLPPKVAVFCIIDGISFYEDSVHVGTTIKVVRQLVGLARKSTGTSSNGPTNPNKASAAASASASSSAPFKLLLTCPGRSSYTMEYGVEEKEILDIEENLVDDDGQGYNDAVWEEDIDPELREGDVEHNSVNCS